MSKAELGFVHLRVHSAYSLSEGAVRIPKLIEACTKHYMPAVAITDSDNLFGALEFSLAAMKAGVQPIIGCVMSIAREEIAGNFLGAPADRPDKIVLIAQNKTGYDHLLALASESFLQPASEDGQGPMIGYSQLEGRTDGLIALSAGLEGTVGRLLLEGYKEEAKAALRHLKGLFPDRLYMELQRHGLAIEKRCEPQLLHWAAELNIPLVATNDAYFLDENDFVAHDALLCVADGRYVDEDDRRSLTVEHRLKTPREMRALFADVPEALANTLEIAKRCAIASPMRDPILPRFLDGDAQDESDEFVRIAEDGLQWRLDEFVFPKEATEAEKEEIAKPYRERLDFELKTIIQMQFPGYFLIVSDFIRWGKQHDIPVGPGRGSGAGSLVAWAMRITDLDPLQFGLLFERFLNPERVSMPDFDVDFCQDRRDEVIHYVQEKYGHDKVAQIITFGKLQARAVLRDVGRVLQMPYGQVDRICKLVPNNPANPCTLQEALDMEPMLQRERKDDAQVGRLIDIALRLEGLYRHSSTHAAGVVIGDRPLQELIPLYRDPRSDMPVVQFSMKYAELAGLVKFDFLGLKTLTVLSTACEIIEQSHDTKLDLLKLPFDDRPTYDMLGRGESVGVFQLESAGMRDTLKKLKPDSMEDIIALVSLYRPGPMDNIPTYIARKHGLEVPEYPHPLIEGILKETFGVIIYQEQVMQIAQVMGGYSLGQADILRRAMGKKIKEEMDKQRDVFVEGAKKKDIKSSKANEVFDLMAKFASYGFNKSHAAAYALIAFQTAYLKANYPVAFFTALMCLDAGNTEKLQLFRQDAERLDIDVLPPNINYSMPNFAVEKQADDYAIRYALGALKNVGMAAMDLIVQERTANGLFETVQDFVTRVDARVLNKRQMEFLIKAGAFDEMHPNRHELMANLDKLIHYGQHAAQERASAQESLFGGGSDVKEADIQLDKTPPWPQAEELAHECDAVGFYLTAHPLQAHEPVLEAMKVTLCADLPAALTSEYSSIKVAGVLSGKKVKVSPKGKFAFLSLSDPTGSYEVSVFDEELLNAHWAQLEEGTMLVLALDAKMEEAGPRLIVGRIQTLADAMKHSKALQVDAVTLHVNDLTDLSAIKLALGSESVGKPNVTMQQVFADESKQISWLLPKRYLLHKGIMDQLSALEEVRILSA